MCINIIIRKFRTPKYTDIKVRKVSLIYLAYWHIRTLLKRAILYNISNMYKDLGSIALRIKYKTTKYKIQQITCCVWVNSAFMNNIIHLHEYTLRSHALECIPINNTHNQSTYANYLMPYMRSTVISPYKRTKSRIRGGITHIREVLLICR